ncbi:MAG TPA: CDP-diacylglycerol--serine O-phosphatidyltransferase [Thermoanaerobaculia bacterium]|nr:CDP-diacylglycerol--serine O-phosphatidyltransferase [Thermoanaerobaculia bacterium]
MNAPPPAADRPSRTARLRRGAYLLPSLITIGNILLGFFSLVTGLRGDYQLAILLIFAAAFVDSLDGRLARVTQTDSDFGREYDSLADVITFGVAPAFLVYSWGLQDSGRIGWLCPLFYLVCTATRLARFNVQTRILDKRFFVGLPAPAAAGALGSILYFCDAIGARGEVVEVLLLAAPVLIGLLMVSPFRYYSFKELDPRRRWSFRVALPITAVLLLLVLHPPGFFITVSGIYALSGPLGGLRGWLRRRSGLAPDGESPDATAQPEETAEMETREP